MRTCRWIAILGCAAALAACGGNDNKDAAPAATALESSAPKSADAKPFTAKPGGSVTWTMEAPIEIMRGKLSEAVSGTLFVDAKDLGSTTGTVSVDLSSIHIAQRKKASESDADYGEEKVENDQIEHAKSWLEIRNDTEEPARSRNKRVDFRIASIDSIDKKDVSKESGEVKVLAKASGEFLLHGHVTKHTVELELTLTMAEGAIKSLRVATKSPFAVNLRQHDVGPRDGVGKGLDKLQPKVAKEAMISLDLSFAPGG